MRIEMGDYLVVFFDRYLEVMDGENTLRGTLEESKQIARLRSVEIGARSWLVLRCVASSDADI